MTMNQTSPIPVAQEVSEATREHTVQEIHQKSLQDD